jgi:hypothetical protein
MTWKLQAITGEFTGQEISIERDMLVGRHQDADFYCNLLIFHVVMQHCCSKRAAMGARFEFFKWYVYE